MLAICFTPACGAACEVATRSHRGKEEGELGDNKEETEREESQEKQQEEEQAVVVAYGNAARPSTRMVKRGGIPGVVAGKAA